MDIRSLFNKQDLTPKQRAIVVFWQNTKGKKGDCKRVQEYIDSYKPVFTEGEMSQMIHTTNHNENIEYYLWGNIINSILFFDMAAQRFYYDALYHLSLLTYGIPYFVILAKSNKLIINSQFYSFNKKDKTSYDVTADQFFYYVFNFFLSAHTSLLLNEFMDNCVDLESLKLLKSVNDVDTNIEKVMCTISKNKLSHLGLLTHYFHDCYEANRSNMIDDSVAQFSELLKPLDNFGLYLPQNDKMTYINRTNDLMDSIVGVFSLDKSA